MGYKIPIDCLGDLWKLNVCAKLLALMWWIIKQFTLAIVIFAAGFTTQVQGVKTDNAEHISTYQSSAWGERAFCKVCGSHLYFHQLGTDNYYVSAGLFDGVAFKLASQIFVDKKACYYELANDTPKLTESEFLAMVAGK